MASPRLVSQSWNTNPTACPHPASHPRLRGVTTPAPHLSPGAASLSGARSRLFQEALPGKAETGEAWQLVSRGERGGGASFRVWDSSRPELPGRSNPLVPRPASSTPNPVSGPTWASQGRTEVGSARPPCPCWHSRCCAPGERVRGPLRGPPCRRTSCAPAAALSHKEPAAPGPTCRPPRRLCGHGQVGGAVPRP